MTDTVAETHELVERARQLLPLLNEYADANDETGRLAEPVDRGAARRRLLRHVGAAVGAAAPSSMPLQSLQVIDELAYGDPSVGWVQMAASLAIGTGAAFLGDDAVAELFGGERFPVIAGQGTRPGKAVARTAATCSAATGASRRASSTPRYIHTLGARSRAPANLRIFVLPVEQATLIDNWDVMGLRGTGSIDYQIRDVFVPIEWSHFGADRDAAARRRASTASGSSASR